MLSAKRCFRVLTSEKSQVKWVWASSLLKPHFELLMETAILEPAGIRIACDHGPHSGASVEIHRLLKQAPKKGKKGRA